MSAGEATRSGRVQLHVNWVNTQQARAGPATNNPDSLSRVPVTVQPLNSQGRIFGECIEQARGYYKWWV